MYERRSPCACGLLHSVGKRKKGITRNRAALKRQPGFLCFPNRDARGIDTRHLPGPDSECAVGSGIDDSLVNYALEIVGRTRKHEKLTLGVSPRGSQMLYRAAQAMAFLDGRSFCVPEDFKPLAVPVFAHRVAIHGMHSSGMKKSVRTEEVIQEIVESVPVPV